MSAPIARRYGGRPVADRRADRRNRFIDAGLQVFADNGYAHSSVSDVCAAAGLSRRQFYEAFEDREALLVAVDDRIQSDARAAVLAAVIGPPMSRPRAVAERILTAYVGALGPDARRAQVSFVETVGVSPAVEEHRRARRAAWAQTFEIAVRATLGSEVRPVGGYPMAATALIGTVHALVYEWLRSEERPPITDLVDVLATVSSALLPTK
ncbi:TetR/AcrR family transcriptional regulator [Skermania piniformis]|uniref:TetR/AcrR family transcriptional regulator n=1 Tax=Skermania pinensis TaxID=39122 RepID=A0ABX8SB04_9ACTN|nr:TetR/AcrR family transcriptional regulator [Skermania piniformis]QXQ14968.1 TetR/AcrR family transcriptional regulator [Skermania piniformis]